MKAKAADYLVYDEVNQIYRENPEQAVRDDVGTIRLYLKGTKFQLKVWETLIKVPAGRLTTYHQLAQSIGQDKASRAVGSAVASNPVAVLIPCHRVIRSTGCLGNYHWGPERKAAIIGWEAAKAAEPEAPRFPTRPPRRWRRFPRPGGKCPSGGG